MDFDRFRRTLIHWMVERHYVEILDGVMRKSESKLSYNGIWIQARRMTKLQVFSVFACVGARVAGCSSSHKIVCFYYFLVRVF